MQILVCKINFALLRGSQELFQEPIFGVLSMQNFTLETYIGKDGILHLDLPVMVKNTTIHVTVTCHPSANEPKEKPVWETLQVFRANTNLEILDIDTNLFDCDRKQQQEREIEL